MSTTDTDASAQTLVDSDVPVPSPQEQPLEKADTQAQAQTMEEKLVGDLEISNNLFRLILVEYAGNAANAQYLIAGTLVR